MNRWSSLKTRGGALRRQRLTLPSTRIHGKTNFRSFASTLAASEASSPVVPKTKKVKKDDKLSKIDLAIFVTYFCNIAVVTLSVVTVPAIALEHNLSPSATAAFCASMASMAPLGGFAGKLVNGFVCQYLGGQRSSWVYLLALSSLCMGMSFSSSLASVGLFLVGFDFLSSIQWTSISYVLNQKYFRNSRLKARGFTILSISSTVGALSAKIFGAGLLKATEWRTVCRCGSLLALVGSATIFFFGGQKKTSSSSDSALGAATSVSAGGQQPQSPLDSLKVVLGNPIFWMIGIGHSLGHLARTSDRLLGPFLQEVGGISSAMAVGLTSSVTIGFVVGLYQGSVFSKMESVKEKMTLLKRCYVASVFSMLGLAACGIKGVSKLVGGNSNIIMAAITLFSGIIACAVSFQFYQVPNLASSTMFPESSSVALSLTDAAGFLVTAAVMGINSYVLGNFGWSACWAFMAVVFSLGGVSMTRALKLVLIEQTKKQRWR